MHTEIKDFPNNPISQAIKLIGVGKRGSRNLPIEIIKLVKYEILDITKISLAYSIQLAAFLSVLGVKENDENESKLFEEVLNHFSNGNPHEKKPVMILTEKLFPNINQEQKDIVVSVFSGKEIQKNEFKQLGKLFFTTTNQDNIIEVFSARAFITSIIRYRYTTTNEYTGLYHSFIENLANKNLFYQKKFSDKVIILSEPFDGVTHSHLVTPIITRELCNLGYIPIVLVSESPGPKMGLTLYDLIQQDWLPVEKLLHDEPVSTTYYCNLNEQFPVFLEWKILRKYTLKRPFLSTMERFFNIFQAKSYLGSAFHGNFNEIMLQLAKNIGYQNIEIVRKGREGSLAFSLAKGTEIYSAKKISNSNFKDNFEKVYYQGKSIEDGRVALDKEKNLQYIQAYLKNENINEEEYSRFKIRALFTLENITKFFALYSEAK